MSIPSDATKTHLDQSTDDPKQARAELASLVDKLNTLLAHLRASTILDASGSSALGLGQGLGTSGGNIVAVDATTSVKGIAELATNAEALALSATDKVLTPSNLNALGSTESQKGIAILASQAEVNAGTDDTKIVTPLKMKNSTSIPKFRTYIYNPAGSYTYTKSQGVSKIKVTCIGGGAGAMAHPGTGSTSTNTTLDTVFGACGGNVAEAVIDATSITSVSVTVGGGGASRDLSQNNYRGDWGGNSSFGGYITAAGGACASYTSSVNTGIPGWPAIPYTDLPQNSFSGVLQIVKDLLGLPPRTIPKSNKQNTISSAGRLIGGAPGFSDNVAFRIDGSGNGIVGKGFGCAACGTSQNSPAGLYPSIALDGAVIVEEIE